MEIATHTQKGVCYNNIKFNVHFGDFIMPMMEKCLEKPVFDLVDSMVNGFTKYYNAMVSVSMWKHRDRIHPAFPRAKQKSCIISISIGIVCVLTRDQITLRCMLSV